MKRLFISALAWMSFISTASAQVYLYPQSGSGNGTVTSVTASTPIYSSGGTTPNITIGTMTDSAVSLSTAAIKSGRFDPAFLPSTVAYLTGGAFTGTITVIENGAGLNLFPATPIQAAGNTNTYFQGVLQNLSNGSSASSDWVLANDLAGDASFYMDIGINSSKFSNALFSSQPSSAAYATSSDSDLFLWSMINGGTYGGVNGRVVIGSSSPVTGNIALEVAPATNSGAGSLDIFSTTTFHGAFQTTSAGFGTGSIPNNAVVFSSGGLVAQSTGSAATQAIIQGLNNSAVAVFTAQNNGVVVVSSGIKYADGSISTTAALGNVAASFVTTQYSSITIQNNLAIGKNFGLAQPSGASTASVTGPIFFISSSSVNGSTATAGGAAYTTFTTATFTNVLNVIGDRVTVECLFQNGPTPTTPTMGIFNTALSQGSSTTQFVYEQITTASQFLLTSASLTLIAPTMVMFTALDQTYSPNNGGGGNSGQVSTLAVSQKVWDPTVAQTFNCSGLSTNNAVNFIWMRVAKQ